jgi:hypothetical protein
MLNEAGHTLVIVGSEKDDHTMHVIIDFSSPYALTSFASHEELKAQRVAAWIYSKSIAVKKLCLKPSNEYSSNRRMLQWLSMKN